MNYYMLKDKVLRWQAELHDLGIPEDKAGEIMRYVEVSAIQEYAKNRAENQLILDLKGHTTSEVAERFGISARAVRKRRAVLFSKRSEPTVPV